MKNWMIKLSLIWAFTALGGKVLYAQTISLRNFELLKERWLKGDDEARDKIDEIEYTYIKDEKNELDQFVGYWQGSLNGKTYELKVVKKINFNFFKDPPTMDLLLVWLTIKDNTGRVIYTNTNRKEINCNFSGKNFQSYTNIYMLNFMGNCSWDSGQVDFNIEDAKLIVYFFRQDDIFAPKTCEPVLPAEKLTLSKDLTKNKD